MSRAVRRDRSAEQTARVLLANAFRHDTWECATAKELLGRAGGSATTVRLQFIGAAAAAEGLDALGLTLYDPAHSAFVGATHRVPWDRIATAALVFQAAPAQVLVVEGLARDTRPPSLAAPGGYRAVSWATCTVRDLPGTPFFTLHPGNAQLLRLDPAVWPAESLPSSPASCTLPFTAQLNHDPALTAVMRELVPPGVLVPESFTAARPPSNARTFTVELRRVQVTASASSGSSKKGEAEAGGAVDLVDASARWSVAAVAHNGYQQLGRGAEAPLRLEYLPSGEEGEEGKESKDEREGRRDKSKSRRKSAALVAALVSEFPLLMEGLPVHSATSLVMAVRRRTAAEPQGRVVGLCVFPLCLMPMQDRDVRVEDLPALKGPFSCEDPRLFTLDAAAPYGKVPLAVTATVAYHDTLATAAPVTAAPAAAAPAGVGVGAVVEDITHDASRSPSNSSLALSSSGSGSGDGKKDGREGQQPRLEQQSGPLLQQQPSMYAEDAAARPTVGPFETAAGPGAAGGGGGGGSAAPDGLYAYLGAIMEELRRLRDMQTEILRRTADTPATAAAAMTPAMQARVNERLTPGTAPELIDLAPRPVAISWRARHRLREGLLPILHPIDGTRLDDGAAAPGQLAGDLYGIRFEGVTMDTSLPLPPDLCVLFSFGSLPLQRLGPAHASSVERGATAETFQLSAPGAAGAGVVWCEPLESLRDPAAAKFREEGGGRLLYLHFYDALTMFYVATARVPVAHFQRPRGAVCALAPLDACLERDLTLTATPPPPEVYPAVANAGQLHLTLFCVGVDASYGAVRSRRVHHPPEAAGLGGTPRCIVAKRLPRADRLLSRDAEDMQPQHATPADGAVKGEGAAGEAALRRSPPTPDRPPAGEEASSSGPTAGTNGTNGYALHAQRAEYLKRALQQRRDEVGPSPHLPGVPGEHLRRAQDQAEMEWQLRYLERERDARKARSITEALLSRITVAHEVAAVGWRPELVRTEMQNPYGVPMRFTVEVVQGAESCAPVGGPSFYLGPRERTTVDLVLRLPYDAGAAAQVQAQAHSALAYVVSETGERVKGIAVRATVGRPLVDRRLEIYGPAGSEVQRRFLSRALSASALPSLRDPAELEQRLQALCAYAATSEDGTVVQTRAVVDPVTQSYVVCWEEAVVQVRVPQAAGQQRTEYVTFFHDAAMTKVRETWELCVFPCEAFTTREIPWGQTTSLGLPAEGTEALYCSDPAVEVKPRGSAFVLRVKPRAVGPTSMLLHALTADGTLRKSLVTVPCAYPTPTYTQVLELSLAETAAPVFRRLTFVHRGDREERFTVVHNYQCQLRMNPLSFTLAPGDTQFVSLQLDMLSLPPGQLEGRWPMWIFINNSDDKTVESYNVQVVLRAHQPVNPIS